MSAGVERQRADAESFVSTRPEFLCTRVALHGGRNGVGSRFRVTIHHMESGFYENDSRPLSPDSTKKHPVGYSQYCEFIRRPEGAVTNQARAERSGDSRAAPQRNLLDFARVPRRKVEDCSR